MQPDRRTVLAASAALAAPSTAMAAAPPQVTKTLAHYLVTSRPGDIPAKVRREGCRSLLNWTGVAVGGPRHESVVRAIAALAPFAGKPGGEPAGPAREVRHILMRA